MEKKHFFELIQQFGIKGNIIDAQPFGGGHINDTFLVVVDENGVTKKYMMQHINTNLFADVDKLMSNIRLVTDFARERIIAKGGDPDRETLTIIPANDGKDYIFDQTLGKYFRVYKFIDNATAYQQVEKPSDFYQVAVAFGSFANLLAEFDATKLYEVLPFFHDTVKRVEYFKQILKEDTLGRAKSVQKEIDFVLEREKHADKIVSLLSSGQMPIKVTHNDTKLNNVMIDNPTGKFLAVIDLDTIMPGSICYDFGDAIRFGCNSRAEDEKDTDKVYFDITLFKIFTEGYLHSLGDSVTQIEKDHLVWGAYLMTYECGTRFLTDYLNGDTYFKTDRPGQNLDRARTQFKLVADMEENFELLQYIVNNVK